MSEFIDDLNQAFIGATILTLKIQCRLVAEHTTSYIKNEQSPSTPFAIGGILGITSAVMKGSAVLCFSKPVFIEILQNLLVGEQITEITRDNQDAAAELLNIIFAQVKTALNKKGYAVQMAIPSVLRGAEINAKYVKGQKVQVLGFRLPSGEFFIEIATHDLDPKEEPLIDPAKAPKVSAATKAAFLLQFVESVILTFNVQFAIVIKAGKPFEKVPDYNYPFDIAGIIGITSNTLNGSLLLVFKQDVFVTLASKVFNEEMSAFQPETADLVAEITNMSLGAAKKILNEQGHGIQMAIPTIIRGREIHSSPARSRKVIVIPFESEIGGFHVEIDIQG